MILIKLAQPIECGITMEGGRRLYERVNVSSEEGGEWFTRQLVTDTEANFFMRVEDRVKQGSSVNVIMGGVRGLPRVTEFDECVLRMTLNNYKNVFKGSIEAFISSLSHDWGTSSTELREEPIIFVCLMDGDLLGADELGKVHPAFTDGKSTARVNRNADVPED